MGQPKHTPGPWEYDADRHAIVSRSQWLFEPYPHDLDMPGIPTEVVNTYGAMGGDDTAADIALMCAAPDMLAACRAVSGANGTHDYYAALDLVRAAITKAER